MTGTTRAARRSHDGRGSGSPFATGPVRVRVPATSANLGPGFDACGLALAWYDELTAEVTPHGLAIAVEGEDGVARDESHLVARSVRATFDALGVSQPGLVLRCVNRIPHGRGLGSSAAAIVAGVVAAGALVTEPALTPEAALEIASHVEGHPDNVAACLLGGFTVAWHEDGHARAAGSSPPAAVEPVAFVPEGRQSTARSRATLPEWVPHERAAFSAGRAALLALAMTSRPDLLFAATRDELHQPYRLPSMPATADLVARLRAEGVAAVLSGSGPTVLALPVTAEQRGRATGVDAPGFRVETVGIDRSGARAERLGPGSTSGIQRS